MLRFTEQADMQHFRNAVHSDLGVVYVVTIAMQDHVI